MVQKLRTKQQQQTADVIEAEVEAEPQGLIRRPETPPTAAFKIKTPPLLSRQATKASLANGGKKPIFL